MYNVLIVDDEWIVRHAVQTLIRWEDSALHYAGSCANGSAALDMLATNPIDIVITDIKMPELDGIQLIKNLRATGYEGEILVLSNYNDFELVREALKQGAHDYVLKLTMNTDNFMNILGEMVNKLNQRPGRHRERSASVQQQEEERILQRQQLFDDLLNLLYTDTVRPGEHNTHKYSTIFEMQQHRLNDPASASYIEQDLYSYSQRSARVEANLPFANHCRDLWQDRTDSDLVTLSIGLLEGADNDSQHTLVQPLTRLLQELFVGEQVLVTSRTEPSLVAMITMSSNVAAIVEQLLQRLVSMVSMYYNQRLTIIYATGTTAATSVNEQLQLCLEMSFVHGTKLTEPVTEAKSLGRNDYGQGGSHTGAVNPAELRSTTTTDHAHKRVQVEQLHTRTDLNEQLANNTVTTVSSAASDHDQGDDQSRSEMMRSDSTSSRSEIEIIRSELPSAVPKSTGSSEWRPEVQQVIAYLQQHYHERIHLPDLAAHVHLSESYLCSVFKAETDKSILTFLNDIRMDRACVLLSSGRLLVKEVAAEVGIHDPFYFNRLFKKRYGISPKKVKAGTILTRSTP